ncbi:MAG TPA: glycosyltransferase family 2 protein, partial [Candidatus Krumholzibacteria bacterium]|nr:glycosyltransferase family 2 protein [Candidatus Krumholzibacteria bacterium]
MSAVQNGASIAIIVLNWNGRDLTLDCLRSLAAVTTPHVRIILVDNASTDGSSDAVRQHYGSRVTLIENAQNLGFAAGNNVGIRRALDDGADFILLLNNDTVVAPDFVDHLHKPMLSSPDIGITAPKIYYAEPKNQIW